MCKREPIVASRSVSAIWGEFRRSSNPVTSIGLTADRILKSCRSHRDGVIIDGLVRNVGGLL